MGVKEWYLQNFPTDELGESINENATFDGLIETLDSYRSVYDYLQESDSLIRERVFEKLADIMEVGYYYIYEQWLKCHE